MSLIQENIIYIWLLPVFSQIVLPLVHDVGMDDQDHDECNLPKKSIVRGDF